MIGQGPKSSYGTLGFIGRRVVFPTEALDSQTRLESWVMVVEIGRGTVDAEGMVGSRLTFIEPDGAIETLSLPPSPKESSPMDNIFQMAMTSLWVMTKYNSIILALSYEIGLRVLFHVDNISSMSDPIMFFTIQ